ncbi:hypothetical protein EJ04DRAFT_70827 [Polyplosphaeria fusca]|uniref:Uncharacterized protein n=1 Tax=Polyplosphaeria fusca TaxID=682080 RepID=A0A9P4R2C5_9PLEO|nr:hypothetical protein EJ04DRAFT_70827 [Polyplosphaeria fusca]
MYSRRLLPRLVGRHIIRWAPLAETAGSLSTAPRRWCAKFPPPSRPRGSTAHPSPRRAHPNLSPAKRALDALISRALRHSLTAGP